MVSRNEKMNMPRLKFDVMFLAKNVVEGNALRGGAYRFEQFCYKLLKALIKVGYSIK